MLLLCSLHDEQWALLELSVFVALEETVVIH